MANKIIRLPAVIDLHVHLRDPGATQKEDFTTGTKAAVAGGISFVGDMPNNPESTTSLQALNKKIRLSSAKAISNIGFFGATQGKPSITRRNIKNVVKKSLGLKVYMDSTTGDLLVQSLEDLIYYFDLWPKTKPILVHAEEATIAKAIGLALTYNKWLHICHVSKAAEVELIAKAKRFCKRSKIGKITCEVTPHHLFLTERDFKKLGNYGVVKPPLQTNQDQSALWKAIRNGVIDCVATDHAPHTKKEKEASNPPSGVPGLETMVPLLMTAVNSGRLTLTKLKELVCKNPAQILGISQTKEVRNSWTEVDLSKEWKLTANELQTKCGWTPFEGWKFSGKVMRTFVNSQKVYDEGQFLIE